MQGSIPGYMRLAFEMFLVLLVLPCSAELRPPVDPAEPKIRCVDGTQGKQYSAILVFASGREMKGSLTLFEERISFTSVIKGVKSLASEPISRIRSVEFKKWKGRPDRKGFLFRPAETVITTVDGTRINCYGSTGLPDKMIFMHGGRSMAVYSIFYDYREKGSWRNLKESAMEYPETHPLPGTVVKIIFQQTPEQGLREFLLRRLKP